MSADRDFPADSEDLADEADPADKQALSPRSEIPAERTVAVLLPLSGRFAAIGVEIQTAVRLAGDSDPRPEPFSLRFLDTRGTPEGAAAAVDRAVLELHALAILGPVGERESQAAARRAVELGVAIALLAPAPAEGEIATAGVYRMWSSPAWEAAQAARVAVDLGYDRLAVLAPRDEIGRASAHAFAEAAVRLGGSVVASGEYDPSARDLEPDIKAFLGLDPRVDERLRRHLARHGRKGWLTFSPDVAFDLLYIPDEYQRAALVASYLPYFNVELRTAEYMDIAVLKKKHRGRVPQVVQLMGSSAWHHPGLITRGGSAVEGALVLDVYAGSDIEDFASDEAAHFAEAFEERHGRLPSPLAAQAFDAAIIVLQAARAAALRGGRVRAAMVQELGRAGISSGACGPARMGAGGAIERVPLVLRVSGDSFVLHEY